MSNPLEPGRKDVEHENLRRCLGPLRGLELRRPITRLLCATSILLGPLALLLHAATVDEAVAAELRAHPIPGLSLAVIEAGRITKAQGYGFTDLSAASAVTTNTLFQAGSISKPVAALGALALVERGALALDTNINAYLKSWSVPENEFTQDEKVTLRRILSHNAGLTVHGFPGYAADQPIPTLVQILDGVKPANTSPVRVNLVPGSKGRYSGGGYTVMQRAIIDITGRPFPEFMRDTVLQPLHLTASTYEQPPPPDTAAQTATGHYQNGKAVQGRWHVYPEMAAAGLWTTPSDLARFVIGIQQSLAVDKNLVVSQAMTRQMLTAQSGTSGLGLVVEGSGRALRFSHGGRNDGFDAFLAAFAETGQGAVIMINANDNSGAVRRVLNAIAEEYGWTKPSR